METSGKLVTYIGIKIQKTGFELAVYKMRIIIMVLTLMCWTKVALALLESLENVHTNVWLIKAATLNIETM